MKAFTSRTGEQNWLAVELDVKLGKVRSLVP